MASHDTVPAVEKKRTSLKEIALTAEDSGKQLTFQIAEGAGEPYFALGIRKSGSTLLHKIMTFLARVNGVTTVDIPGTFFRSGFLAKDWLKADLEPVVKPGNLYVGFRAFPVSLADKSCFKSARKVFMFRDPRDALVSQYFSDAYSHQLPQESEATTGRELFLKKRREAQSAEINEWVIAKSLGMRNTLLKFTPLLDDPNCLVLRYEDYVFQKRRLVHKVLKKFDWQMRPGQIEALMQQVDVVPEAEVQTKFIRKAVPGDHVVKLQPDTIKRLNHRLADVLERYDYY